MTQCLLEEAFRTCKERQMQMHFIHLDSTPGILYKRDSIWHIYIDHDLSILNTVSIMTNLLHHYELEHSTSECIMPGAYFPPIDKTVLRFVEELFA